MDLYQTIKELRREKQELDRTIAVLEELAALQRGQSSGTYLKRRGRKSMGAAERREVSARMKKYWAARRARRQKE
jgi:hypothetical protein